MNPSTHIVAPPPQKQKIDIQKAHVRNFFLTFPAPAPNSTPRRQVTSTHPAARPCTSAARPCSTAAAAALGAEGSAPALSWRLSSSAARPSCGRWPRGGGPEGPRTKRPLEGGTKLVGVPGKKLTKQGGPSEKHLLLGFTPKRGPYGVRGSPEHFGSFWH